MPYRRRDDNQADITQALQAAGASVADLGGVGGGVPDLLVGCESPCPHCGAWLPCNWLLEVKNLAGRGDRLTPAELAFHASWKGKLAIVHDAIEALQLLGKVGR